MPPRDAARARRRRRRQGSKNLKPVAQQPAPRLVKAAPDRLRVRKRASTWLDRRWHLSLLFLSSHFRSKQIRQRWVSLLFILLGAGLLTYVVSQYAEMYRSQKDMAAQWTAQERPANNAAIDPSLTRLIIPKINLDSFVVEGTSHKALLRGPGHLKNSAEPGQPGNVIISAHRDTFFRHVFELGKGDQVQVQHGGKTAVYEVTEKKVVDPDNVEVLRQTKDPRLTLITCYPTYYIGPAPQRAIVIAKLVSLQDSTRASASQAGAH